MVRMTRGGRGSHEDGWRASSRSASRSRCCPRGLGGPAAAQDAPTCVPEVEPNDRLADAPSMAGDLCQTGRLEGDREQDLLLWEVAPEDGLTRWTFTVRGVPTTVTSIRVLHILPTAAANEVTVDDIGAEVTRVDSDAHPDTPPGTATLQLAPGRYLLGISRGTPSFGQTITADRDYRVSIVADRTLPASGDAEPNDDATSAHAVTGAFDLSGDLVSTEDHYRWTVSGAETAQLWRVEARSSMDAPLTLEIAEPGSPAPLAYGTAGPDGVVALHDLALAPGDYDVTLSPGAAVAQPYVLAAAPVTEEDVDSEPNDAPEQALPWLLTLRLTVDSRQTSTSTATRSTSRARSPAISSTSTCRGRRAPFASSASRRTTGPGSGAWRASGTSRSPGCSSLRADTCWTSPARATSPTATS